MGADPTLEAAKEIGPLYSVVKKFDNEQLRRMIFKWYTSNNIKMPPDMQADADQLLNTPESDNHSEEDESTPSIGSDDKKKRTSKKRTTDQKSKSPKSIFNFSFLPFLLPFSPFPSFLPFLPSSSFPSLLLPSPFPLPSLLPFPPPFLPFLSSPFFYPPSLPFRPFLPPFSSSSPLLSPLLGLLLSTYLTRSFPCFLFLGKFHSCNFY